MFSSPHNIYFQLRLKSLIPTFTFFFPLLQRLLVFTDFCTTLTNLNHFTPTFIIFHQFLQTLTNFVTLYYFSSIKNGSIFYHLLTCTCPTILLDNMLQALIICLFLSLHALCCLYLKNQVISLI